MTADQWAVMEDGASWVLVSRYARHAVYMGRGGERMVRLVMDAAVWFIEKFGEAPEKVQLTAGDFAVFLAEVSRNGVVVDPTRMVGPVGTFEVGAFVS